MPKPRAEINPKSAKRLKELCNGKPITQMWLSEKTGVTQNTLSKIATGKTAMTEYVAQMIVSVVPDVRREWLMGYDDFKTEADRISFIVGKNYSRKDLIKNLISLHGYTIMDVTDEEGYQCKKVEGTPEKAEEEKQKYKEPMIEISSPKGTKRYLSCKDFEGLLKAIDDYIEMQLLFRFRKLGDGTKEYWGKIDG